MNCNFALGLKSTRKIPAATSFDRLIVFATLVILGLFSDLSSASMTMPGDFKVDSSGAVTYTIPIQVPPGIAGIEPGLDFNYNSNGSNGLLGVGWSLSGLSTITRCPMTAAQDSVRGAVQYNVSDRFCLDGKRLIVVAGTYGADGSEYRTEIETFTKITAYGAAPGGGPAYFIVKTQAGLTTEYGRTDDSSVEVAGKSPRVVRVWALDKVSDPKGNTLVVSYIKSSAPATPSTFTGAYYPNRIDYTSNTITGLGSKNSIIFGYEYVRGDVPITYVGGYAISSPARLKTVTTASAGATVTTYSLVYEQGSASGRSRVKSITLCGADGLCLPPTSMNFPVDPTASFAIEKTQLTGAQADVTALNPIELLWLTGDFSGDGKRDVIAIHGDIFNSWISSDATGGFDFVQFKTISQTTNPGFGDPSIGSWFTMDVNADGKMDIVHTLGNRVGSSGPWYQSELTIYLSRGDGTFQISSYFPPDEPVLGYGTPVVMDMNGDGRMDIVIIRSVDGGALPFHVYQSNGDGTFTAYSVSRTGDGPIYGSWHVLDVNGDGLLDLVHLSQHFDTAWVWKTTELGEFRVSTIQTGISCGSCGAVIRMGDFNGDHLTDILILDPGTTLSPVTVKLLTSKGDGTFVGSSFTTAYEWYSGEEWWLSGYFAVADMNGDGLSDLVHVSNGQSYAESGWVRTWISDGKGGFSISKFTTSLDTTVVAQCDDHCEPFQLGDFKGEDRNDFFHLANQQIVYWTSRRVSKDVPSSISVLPGNNISWTRSPLPKILGNRYFQEKRSLGPGESAAAGQASNYLQWPLVSPVSPLSVVTEVVSSTGVGDAVRKTSYSYGTALIEAGIKGRGFLGFNWQQAIDERSQGNYSGTGLVSRSYFRQDFPYIGMIDRTGQGTSAQNWGNLSLTTNTYNCLSPNEPTEASTSTCNVLAANARRYFPYLSQSTTQKWDLNGAALPGTKIQNLSLDAYGNILAAKAEVLNPDGTTSGYSKSTQNTFYNRPQDWYLGRLTKSVITNSSTLVTLDVVVPGSGSLPPTPSPTLPPQLLSIILSLLLDD